MYSIFLGRWSDKYLCWQILPRFDVSDCDNWRFFILSDGILWDVESGSRKQGTAITRTSVSGLQIMLLLVLAAYAACNSIQVSASSWSQASSSTI